MVEHVFKVTLQKKLIGLVSRYALNQIVVELLRVSFAGIDSSRCGCVMRTTHGFLYWVWIGLVIKGYFIYVFGTINMK